MEIQHNNTKIAAIVGDITNLRIDSIVNAANSTLLGGGGVDGAIHKAAGPELLIECRTLNGCETGDAKITQGYNLPSKFIIHAVGPIWEDGKNNEIELLEKCYIKSLALAEAKQLKSIAFPCISTGIYGFPKSPAAKIATTTVAKYLLTVPNTSLEEIIFCCFSEEDLEHYNYFLKNISILTSNLSNK